MHSENSKNPKNLIPSTNLPKGTKPETKQEPKEKPEKKPEDSGASAMKQVSSVLNQYYEATMRHQAQVSAVADLIGADDPSCFGDVESFTSGFSLALKTSISLFNGQLTPPEAVEIYKSHFEDLLRSIDENKVPDALKRGLTVDLSVYKSSN